MDVIYQRCCGVDVHKKVLAVCLMRGKKKENRNFGTSTCDLLALADWLQENQCEAVAMESTASYWKPLYNVLEATDMKVIVANPQHIKNIPGKKTDVKDSEWIADLLRHGLCPSSFIPDRSQRELREQLKYRQSLVWNRAAELNRLQKMLEGGNIKLSGTVADILGKSSRVLLEGILSGRKFTQEDIEQMFEDRILSKNLKASAEQLAKDLEGVLSEAQIEMMKMCLGHIDYLTATILKLDKLIDNELSSEQREAVELLVDIPGVSKISAKAIVAVLGTDMERFESERHLSKWAGICPGNNESAGKRRSGRTTRGNALLRTTLVQCAQGASQSKGTFFSAQYSRLVIRRGANRAKVAVAHSMLIAIWHMLKYKLDFVDLGSDYYNQFNREKKANALKKKLIALGYDVEITEKEYPEVMEA